MRIQVTKVRHDRSGALDVTFRCSAGGATARWLGRTHLPELGRLYDVELDVEATAVPGVNLQTAVETDQKLMSDNNFTSLRVKVEGQDADGMAYLRLADDCLFMMEATGEVALGKTVEIRVPTYALSVTATGSL